MNINIISKKNSQPTWGDVEGLTWRDVEDQKWNDVTIPNIIKIFSRKSSSNIISQSQSLLNIKNAYKNNNLVLVLGAGVSKQCKLPDWNTLIENLRQFIHINSDDRDDYTLIKAKLFIKFFNTSPLITARYIRQHCGSDKAESILFEKLVRDVLYNENEIKYTKLFSEIGSLCKGKDKSAINCIITYNYDDLLERFLDKPDVNIPYKSIYYSSMRINSSQLPIYHVHGFLPSQGELTARNGIILSEEAYHRQYANAKSWNNKIQLKKLTNCTCLFIGSSFIDPNIRRLLDLAMKENDDPNKCHYIIRPRYDISEVKRHLKQLLKHDVELFEEKSRSGIGFDNAAEDVKKMNERFLEDDALSLGMQTIWADTYDGIADILHQISTASDNQ